MIGSDDQWRRASYFGTALVDGVAQLAWVDDGPGPEPGPPPPPGAGLAFDGQCRLYHSVPGEGRVERLIWMLADPLSSSGQTAQAVDLFEAPAPTPLGDFMAPAEPPLSEPRGLAVDDDDHLFISETAGRCLLVFDLWSQRLLRRVGLPGRPLDLAACGGWIYAVLDSPPGLLRLTARTEPHPLALPAGLDHPSRLTVSPGGQLFVLAEAGTAQSRVYPIAHPASARDVPFATDLAFQYGDPVATRTCATGNDVLVVARFPGMDFLRFCLGPDGWAAMPPLNGGAYDGRGIVLAPNGRIGFWTARGFRTAVASRLHYLSEGNVVGFRLDSGDFHTVWGRLFLDACIPDETDVRAYFATADEPPEGATWLLQPPANDPGQVVPRPDLSPPLPPLALVPLHVTAPYSFHRRETGRELPWVRFASDDPFATYEAPINAGPGRYLWVVLAFSGNTRTTPQVRSLRAEYPSHDYLRRLPKTLSRDDQAASFLLRYLAIFDGALGELQARADARHVLIDPRSSPVELLPWLASFLGLALDERWSESVRRTLIAEAAWLFRFRGTVPGLTRFLEICTGATVILLERFRLRGMGGTLLGESPASSSTSVVGTGFRAGGAVGQADATDAADDGFATHAHRFMVFIAASLTTDQLAMVRDLLDAHRPAHTRYDLCTVAEGSRLGQGLHVGLTSMIGGSGRLGPLQVGGSLVGRDAVVGRPVLGTVPGARRLGQTSQVG
jgi:phage tail-like protein